jgi:membrane-associated phospholipid phosphatase
LSRQRRWVAALGALILFGWLASEVALGRAPGFDAGGRALVHQLASPGLTAAMRTVTELGPGVFFWVAAACVAVVLLYRRRTPDAARLVITLAGAGLLDMTLKAAFHRPRPVPFFDTPLPDSYSFPSGHALFSLCFYGTLAALLAGRTRRPALRVAVWVLGVALIVLIGLSRIYLGVHYPSDVIAGYAVGLAWLLAVRMGERVL